MKTIVSTAIMVLLAALVSTTQAQKKPYYTEQEQVIEAAYNALDLEMKEGDIIEWAGENQVTGAYTFNITITGKGLVATVSVVDREGGDVPSQNRLKNYIKNFRFPFKMPKNKSYKFKYKFKF